MYLDGFDLGGRQALVTGGSIGIGRAIALALAQAGANVAIQFDPKSDSAVAREGAADETLSAIQARGRTALAIPADFETPDAARDCFDQARASLGAIDILVLCASVQTRLAFDEITPALIDQHVAVNFAASIALLQAALPGMAAAGWGRVLSIGSVNAVRPDPELAVYAALKAAQHNLIVNLAQVHAPSGVTLNTLSPGLIATDRNRHRREDAAAWQAIVGAANPMARAGTPEDVAGAALLLCSPAGGFITGIDFPVAGGAQL
ncbi:SDR family NAD(P)-dependent oxidoreductase [Sphingomonas sp. R-74633]|uniref:SDR family NAD(P)-dependent oxidoreductase n=1 Tax=Sphingomonas sp. R-74633 TaxID=2751188 RepID=UPI001C54FE27|nr:SDR family oxidoreductase [Sphingomonas sp. R-74633]